MAAVLLATALAGAPGAARADAAQARAHFEKGRSYFEVDEYDKAIEEFKAAHVEKPDPAYLLNIAECYRHLGEYKQAVAFYRRFLTLAPANDPLRPKSAKRIAELQGKEDEPPHPSAPPPAATEPPPPLPPAAPPPPEAEAPAPLVATPAPPRREHPFYTRGWFIAAVAVAVVAGSVGVWAATRGGSDVPSTPLGNQSVF
ncbi:MAG TPA: tetratricopeptide repeat protein [Polyangia bacterium]|nr:tetratricopeptide repeat protein [Polyangia bacterium]